MSVSDFKAHQFNFCCRSFYDFELIFANSDCFMQFGKTLVCI